MIKKLYEINANDIDLSSVNKNDFVLIDSLIEIICNKINDDIKDFIKRQEQKGIQCIVYHFYNFKDIISNYKKLDFSCLKNSVVKKYIEQFIINELTEAGYIVKKFTLYNDAFSYELYVYPFSDEDLLKLNKLKEIYCSDILDFFDLDDEFKLMFAPIWTLLIACLSLVLQGMFNTASMCITIGSLFIYPIIVLVANCIRKRIDYKIETIILEYKSKFISDYKDISEYDAELMVLMKKYQ